MDSKNNDFLLESAKTIEVDSLDRVSYACGVVMDAINASNFAHDEVFAIHLALEEAVVNAIKHGNNCDSSKKAYLSYSISDDRVDIVVSDEGGGFDPSRIPDPCCDDNLCKASGRGLFLIKSYMDLVEYNDSGNSIHMVKYSQKVRESDR